MSPGDWSALFQEPVENSARGCWRVVSKNGQSLLLLPPDRRCAARGLELYPAQTAKARLACATLRFGLRLGLPLPLPTCELGPPVAPLAAWLAQIAGHTDPVFAVLLGNPAADGRRFILLVFDPSGEPCAVIKIGATDAARALIDAEVRALESLPAGTAGTPTVRDSFAEADLRAVAFDFVVGKSPRTADDEAVFALLRTWLRTDRSTRLADLPAWQRLAQSAAAHPRWPRLAEALSPLEIHPCVSHGDFAPWNLRGCGAHWTAVDWERGEPLGVPGWDALHYFIQRAVLVERRSTPELVALVERTFRRREVAEYLRVAGLAAHGGEIVLSYLLHACEVLRPTEGLAALRALLPAWIERGTRGK